MKKLPTYYKSPHKIAGKAQDSAVLLALSGGADSTSLLYNLVADAAQNGFRVCAAHLNHNIRLGDYANEAARDEQFCRALCERLGVEFFSRSVDVPALAAQSGESLEGEARRARYAFFEEIMEKENISILVTAHNADDNLETQIFNLCRGSALSGLAGIPVLRPLGEKFTIVRPILSAAKVEILDFCRENEIEYVTDSTNFEDIAVRNKIRSNVTPAICEIFPSAHRASARLAISALEAHDYIAGAAQGFLLENAEFSDRAVSIPRNGFNSLHIAPRREAVRLAAERLGVRLEYIHIDDVIALAKTAAAGKRLDLPSSLVAYVDNESVIFSIGFDLKPDCDGYNVGFNGKLAVTPDTAFAVATAHGAKDIDTQKYALYSSAILHGKELTDSILSGRASIRSRISGDTICDGGNTKKLKKLMCDKRLPLADRAAIPLLCLGAEVIYAPMCAICDRAKHRDGNEIEIFVYKKL